VYDSKLCENFLLLLMIYKVSMSLIGDTVPSAGDCILPFFRNMIFNYMIETEALNSMKCFV